MDASLQRLLPQEGELDALARLLHIPSRLLRKARDQGDTLAAVIAKYVEDNLFRQRDTLFRCNASTRVLLQWLQQQRGRSLRAKDIKDAAESLFTPVWLLTALLLFHPVVPGLVASLLQPPAPADLHCGVALPPEAPVGHDDTAAVARALDALQLPSLQDVAYVRYGNTGLWVNQRRVLRRPVHGAVGIPGCTGMFVVLLRPRASAGAADVATLVVAQVDGSGTLSAPQPRIATLLELVVPLPQVATHALDAPYREWSQRIAMAAHRMCDDDSRVVLSWGYRSGPHVLQQCTALLDMPSTVQWQGLCARAARREEAPPPRVRVLDTLDDPPLDEVWEDRYMRGRDLSWSRHGNIVHAGLEVVESSGSSAAAPSTTTMAKLCWRRPVLRVYYGTSLLFTHTGNRKWITDVYGCPQALLAVTVEGSILMLSRHGARGYQVTPDIDDLNFPGVCYGFVPLFPAARSGRARA